MRLFYYKPSCRLRKNCVKVALNRKCTAAKQLYQTYFWTWSTWTWTFWTCLNSGQKLKYRKMVMWGNILASFSSKPFCAVLCARVFGHRSSVSILHNESGSQGSRGTVFQEMFFRLRHFGYRAHHHQASTVTVNTQSVWATSHENAMSSAVRAQGCR